MRKVLLCIILLGIVLLPLNSFALLSKGCPADPASAAQINMAAMYTLYNILPIKIGAVPVFPLPGIYDDKFDYPFPICICLLPIPRFGLTLSYWNPIEMYEVVKIPFCFPFLGADMPINEIVKGLIAGSDASKTILEETNKQKFAQVHIAIYPIWKLLDLFMDTVCMDVAGSTGDSLDIAYMTEVDPFWQNDLLTAIFSKPETLLFANPITQFACIADAVASTVSRPINTLFWCAGAWGSVYPVTGHVDERAGTITANILLASRALYGTDPQGKIVTSDKSTVVGSCQTHPSPFWKKSQFSWLQLYPVVQSLRMQIGKAPITWVIGKNPPVPGKCDHFDYMLYRKKSCCLF